MSSYKLRGYMFLQSLPYFRNRGSVRSYGVNHAEGQDLRSTATMKLNGKCSVEHNFDMIIGNFFYHSNLVQINHPFGLIISDYKDEKRLLANFGVCHFVLPFHRALAAFAAICERFRGLSLAARALPPLRPPSRPSSTAAGFLTGSAGGSYFGACPVDSSITW